MTYLDNICSRVVQLSSEAAWEFKGPAWDTEAQDLRSVLHKVYDLEDKLEKAYAREASLTSAFEDAWQERNEARSEVTQLKVLRPCGITTAPHPAHSWMQARRIKRCPGILE